MATPTCPGSSCRPQMLANLKAFDKGPKTAPKLHPSCILGPWGKERDSKPDRVGWGKGWNVSCDSSRDPSVLFFNSLNLWTSRCNFLLLFYGCIRPEFLIWECWCGMDRDRTCRTKVKHAHEERYPWESGEITICHRQWMGRCLSWSYLDVWEMAGFSATGLHAAEEAKATRHW